MRVVVITVAIILTLVPRYWSSFAAAQAEPHALDFIHMTGPLAGWAVTVPREPHVNELLHTSDGGVHWLDVTPRGSSSVEEPAVLTSLVAWVESSTLLQTIDGGRTWRSLGPLPMFRTLGNPIPFAAGGTLDFIDARNGWRMMGVGAAGSEEVYIHRTTDGGATWVKVTYTTSGDEASGLPFGGDKAGITFLNATTGWVTGYTVGCDYTYLFVTHNGGHTWRQQRFPLPPLVTSHWNDYTMPPTFFSTRDGVLPILLSYSVKDQYCESGKTVVVFYVTHDGGATWMYTTPVEVRGAPASSFADMAHGWVTDGNVLYLTRDGGHRWTKVLLPLAFADIKQLDFISPQVGWAVRGPTWTLKRTPPSLLKTVDGGHTWAPAIYTISHR